MEYKQIFCGIYARAKDDIETIKQWERGHLFCKKNNFTPLQWQDITRSQWQDYGTNYIFALKNEIKRGTFKKLWVSDLSIFLDDEYVLNFLDFLNLYNVELYVNDILQDIEDLIFEYCERVFKNIIRGN